MMVESWYHPMGQLCVWGWSIMTVTLPLRTLERELACDTCNCHKKGLLLGGHSGRLHLRQNCPASLLLPVPTLRRLRGLDLPQLGSSLRSWPGTFLSIYWDLACHWLPACLPARRKWEGLNCTCSLEKVFKRGCNLAAPFCPLFCWLSAWSTLGFSGIEIT